MNFEQIWDEYHQQVRAFIAHRVRNSAAADDLLQNVFLKIHAHLGTVKESEKVPRWIFQIARNAVIDFYRTQRAAAPLPEDLLESAEAGEEQNFTREASACIRDTLQRLPAKYREALELVELEGLSQKEASARLGISYSGAKSRVQRGREKLKALLTGCCHIEADRYGNIVNFRILRE